MNIVIRKELPSDYRRTEEVAREAFWNLYFPGASVHYLVHKMRSHEDYLPELSFVIEADGVVEGAIFYTKAKISGGETEYDVISFGPVFITPALHRRGLGRRLIEHSVKLAKSMGYRAILTLGYPYHYQTYGFCGAKKYLISMADGKYYTGLLALPLYEGALNGCSGIAVFSDVFAAEEDFEAIEEFDKSFPAKKKLVLPSQEEYEKACAMLDE